MRIKEHPILTFPEKKKIWFTFNGQKVFGFSGDTIAAALHALGVMTLSHSLEMKRPRGFYCAIGNCASCNMIVDGIPNVRTCVVSLKEGMVVKTQTNKGDLNDI
ncbi:pyridine nucleotide-disulfide oxidoreductase [Candidatus Izimaplasma bacterium ZiA1]|uniref:(2Fe-2S)-binding protein n=1 Tax=Candidatus Izimoplasma sp. ZiA1 TaxID=2024899 RepID=UPI000BAA6AEF|nr:pyridine nucleotide-disulfide oxidoreductase [Candidatus Izimaplasma bacterium ZiA1]